MTRRRGAGEKGARRRCLQDERCAKYDVRGVQPDVRSRSAAAVVGEAHRADARRRRGGPLLCRRRRCVTSFRRSALETVTVWASALACRALGSRLAAR